MVRWLPVLVALAGCTPGESTSDNPDDTGSDSADPAADAPEPFRSSFRQGGFAVTELELLLPSEGLDLTGDDLPDNNLPNALKPIDLLLADMDLSLTGFNATVATAIGAGNLTVLLDVRHDFPELEIDVLGGRTDWSGTIVVDPASFTDGEPRSQLHGMFVTERVIHVTPGEASVPLTLFPESDPVWIPMVQARLEGEIDEDGVEGVFGGIMPTDLLIDEVFAEAIDPAGYDADGDGTIDYTRDQLLDAFRGFAELESIADVDLGGGRRGVSCAFRLTAIPASYDVP